MEYKHTASPQDVAEALLQCIEDYLSSGKTVLWLISGGSALAIAVAVSNQLKSSKNLTIAQIDERFGPVGHKDSNWQQFIEKGFNPDNFTVYPILTGKDVETTTADYNTKLTELIAKNDVIVGLLGIGADGHTSGILPHSEAVAQEEALVTHYQGPDYQRITTTPAFFPHLDDAYVYAVGENKWPVLTQLSQPIAIADQPAQLLKRARHSVVYSDKGDIS